MWLTNSLKYVAVTKKLASLVKYKYIYIPVNSIMYVVVNHVLNVLIGAVKLSSSSSTFSVDNNHSWIVLSLNGDNRSSNKQIVLVFHMVWHFIAHREAIQGHGSHSSLCQYDHDMELWTPGDCCGNVSQSRFMLLAQRLKYLIFRIYIKLSTHETWNQKNIQIR